MFRRHNSSFSSNIILLSDVLMCCKVFIVILPLALIFHFFIFSFFHFFIFSFFLLFFQRRSVGGEELRRCILSRHFLAIVLVDKRKLRCPPPPPTRMAPSPGCGVSRARLVGWSVGRLVGWSRSHPWTDRACVSGCCGSHPGYTGHYVVLNGYDEGRGEFEVQDPASPK